MDGWMDGWTDGQTDMYDEANRPFPRFTRMRLKRDIFIYLYIRITSLPLLLNFQAFHSKY
jgi:hypothetical protein